jgi:hypothetical protein
VRSPVEPNEYLEPTESVVAACTLIEAVVNMNQSFSDYGDSLENVFSQIIDLLVDPCLQSNAIAAGKLSTASSNVFLLNTLHCLTVLVFIFQMRLN